MMMVDALGIQSGYLDGITSLQFFQAIKPIVFIAPGAFCCGQKRQIRMLFEKFANELSQAAMAIRSIVQLKILDNGLPLLIDKSKVGIAFADIDTEIDVHYILLCKKDWSGNIVLVRCGVKHQVIPRLLPDRGEKLKTRFKDLRAFPPHPVRLINIPDFAKDVLR